MPGRDVFGRLPITQKDLGGPRTITQRDLGGTASHQAEGPAGMVTEIGRMEKELAMSADHIAPLVFLGLSTFVGVVALLVLTDNVATLERITLPAITFGAGFLAGRALKGKEQKENDMTIRDGGPAFPRPGSETQGILVKKLKTA